MLKARKLNRIVKELTQLLGGEIADPGCGFANGDGYYQLTAESVRQFDHGFTEAVKEFEPDLFAEYSKKNLTFVVRNYFTGRWLDDTMSPLNSLVRIRYNIDDKFRRWGQMYYANNPNIGKQVKLGDL